MKACMPLVVLALAVGASALHCTGSCQQGDDNSIMGRVRVLKDAQWSVEGEFVNCTRACPIVEVAIVGERVACGTDGFADKYECNNVDLLAFLPLDVLGSQVNASGNDIWGWTDPTTNREYVIMGAQDGTSFTDISDPMNPLVLGFLPSHIERYVDQFWRDMKVYQNHVYIVGDRGDHGMQVFDLTRLRGLSDDYQGPTTFTEDVFYDEFGPCHNIAINEESGFAYCIGSRTCRGGPHMIDIREPKNPQFVGCAANDGYSHDAECINYDGPDERFVGQEICFSYNEDSLTIYDVTDKEFPCVISRTEYTNATYTHQGWLTEDRQYLLLNDELDELRGKNEGFTQTFIWDVRSLTTPENIASYYSPVKSIDHNIYIMGQYSYQSNYESGLRINDITRIADGVLTEAGFFDIHPEGNEISFSGTWSNYPYFESGVVAVSARQRGLFLLKPTIDGMKELSPAIDRLITPTEPPTLPWWCRWVWWC